MFKVLSEGIFEIILGTPSEQTTKKTIPLPKREKGIFGCPVASFCCTEEQGRGSLHMHVIHWGSLPPSLLQNCATRKILLEAVIKAIDLFIQGQLKKETCVEYLADKIERKRRPKPCLVDHLNGIFYNAIIHYRFKNTVLLTKSI